MATFAIVVGAGKGTRAGRGTPKIYRSIGGVPVLKRTLSAFVESKAVDYVLPVIGKEDGGRYEELRIWNPKMLAPLCGGETRADSVRRALEHLRPINPQYVFVHDGARPFISQALIGRVASALWEHEAVVPVLPVKNSLKRKKPWETLSKGNYVVAQTPQGFAFEILWKAFQDHFDPMWEDECRAVERMVEVHMVSGDPGNKKMTYGEDFEVEKIVKTATGLDVHALIPATSITICGLSVPSSHRCLGHSDGDVALHAISDALLGLIAEGDIGDFFPATEENVNMDSKKILKEVLDRVLKKGMNLDFVDVTIVGNVPPISQYRTRLRKNLADLLGISISSISLKATTTDHIGALGRGEGLMAIATVTGRGNL